MFLSGFEKKKKLVMGALFYLSVMAVPSSPVSAAEAAEDEGAGWAYGPRPPISTSTLRWLGTLPQEDRDAYDAACRSCVEPEGFMGRLWGLLAPEKNQRQKLFQSLRDGRDVLLGTEVSHPGVSQHFEFMLLSLGMGPLSGAGDWHLWYCLEHMPENQLPGFERDVERLRDMIEGKKGWISEKEGAGGLVLQLAARWTPEAREAFMETTRRFLEPFPTKEVDNNHRKERWFNINIGPADWVALDVLMEQMLRLRALVTDWDHYRGMNKMDYYHALKALLKISDKNKEEMERFVTLCLEHTGPENTRTILKVMRVINAFSQIPVEEIERLTARTSAALESSPPSTVSWFIGLIYKIPYADQDPIIRAAPELLGGKDMGEWWQKKISEAISKVPEGELEARLAQMRRIIQESERENTPLLPLVRRLLRQAGRYERNIIAKNHTSIGEFETGNARLGAYEWT